MKKSVYFSSTIFISLLTMCMLTLSSCGDDEVQGCTNNMAVNYNADATSDDGSCTFARDKFVGSYQGEFACSALSVLNSDDVTFDLSEGIDASKINELIITITSGPAVGLFFSGIVDNNSISISQELQSPIPDFGSGLFNLSATGDVTTNDQGDSFSGNLTIVIKDTDGNELATDTCTISGQKIG